MKLYRFLFALLLFPFSCPASNIQVYHLEKSTVVFELQDGVLQVEPLSDRSVRVRFYKELKTGIPEIILNDSAEKPEFSVQEKDGNVEIRTKFTLTKVSATTGQVQFEDQKGKSLLSEIAGGRFFSATNVDQEPAYSVEQCFDSPQDEVILGLGQFQDGYLDLRGRTRELIQVNTQIALPFVYSSRGYGLLWHQYGKTEFNPADNLINLVKVQQGEIQNQAADVTTTSGTIRISQDQSRYQGDITVAEDGEYSFFLNLGDMGNRHFLSVDGQVIIDQSNMWLPPSVGVKIKLSKGVHRMEVLCKNTNNPVLSWRKVDQTTRFRSPTAKELDYIFIAGSADEVIRDYRKLTGDAPMLPAWAYGFWQCRERYSSSDQLIKTAEAFREKQIPVDALVQDWQYWGKNGWGVPEFDSDNYPNPEQFIRRLHDLRTRLMVSIWSNPDKNSSMGQNFESKKLYIPDSKWLDYFNPETRNAYWRALQKNMFEKGVDAWWMDAVEPENDALKGTQTFWGKGDFLRLVYPYFVSKAVYEGQRACSDQKRVCILTRSAFPGQQKFGVVNWSGDIGGTWDAYRRQIVAGLNYTICGFPYWTTDIGGFFRPGRSQYTDDAYQELSIRWFQWGALNPVFRVHGYQSETEPWKYKPETEKAIRSIINFRYQLMPYIYSLAWQVTSNGSTIMRPLIMDFSNDSKAIRQSYEYMFGPGLLVCPVLKPGVESQDVYLPDGTSWYDFYSNAVFNGGQSVQTRTSLSDIPIFVREGSILPLGKSRQTVSVPTDSIELRVYEGKDGRFTLYQDSGDSYAYEKGACSAVQINWEEKTHTLTLENREGTFEGMPSKIIFNVCLIRKSKSVKNLTKSLNYRGDKIRVRYR